jgi:outer membrane protein OmpA-like peptidoglycan-associated protein
MNRAALAALLAVGCATGPSQELIDARAAYARAAASPAAQVTPGLLRTARDELARAEAARGGERDHRGYVALRRAEIAEASAQAILAAERRNEIDHQIAEIERGRAAAPAIASAESKPAPAAPPGEPSAVVENGAGKEPAAPVASSPAPASSAGSSTARQAPTAQSSQALDRLASVGSVRNGARGVEVTLSGAGMFAANDAKLAPEALASLENVAAAVKSAPGRDPVVLEVHTAGRASREAELMLSQQRAETVRSFLISRGVEPERVIARGVGSDRPLDATSALGGGRAVATDGLRAAAPAGEDRLEIILPAGTR